MREKIKNAIDNWHDTYYDLNLTWEESTEKLAQAILDIIAKEIDEMDAVCSVCKSGLKCWLNHNSGREVSDEI